MLPKLTFDIDYCKIFNVISPTWVQSSLRAVHIYLANSMAGPTRRQPDMQAWGKRLSTEETGDACYRVAIGLDPNRYITTK